MRSFVAFGVLLAVCGAGCSVINAPGEIVPGSGGSGGSGGGTGGATTSSTTTNEGGTGGMMNVCGDGSIGSTEECDDGSTENGDGCSSACVVEAGFDCTGEPSTCVKLCGNGTVDMGEECDDGGYTDDPSIGGNDDMCAADCKYQEFDVEFSGLGDQWPSAGFRQENGKSAFVAFWNQPNAGVMLMRRYPFGGTPTYPPFEQPSGAGVGAQSQRILTNKENRSLLLWLSTPDNQLHTTGIGADGGVMFTDVPVVSLQNPNIPYGLATNGESKFLISIMRQTPGNPTQFDVVTQAVSNQLQGIDAEQFIGSAVNQPTNTAVAGLDVGFLVMWVTDPTSANPVLFAQQLDAFGKVMPGFTFQLTDPVGDGVPTQVYAEGSGAGKGFFIAYVSGVTGQQRIVLRRFVSPSQPAGPPILVSDKHMGLEQQPRIVVNPDTKKIAVVWSEMVDAFDIKVRVFDYDGTPLTSDLVVNDITPKPQTFPGVACDPKSGDVAFVWDTEEPQIHVAGRVMSALLK